MAPTNLIIKIGDMATFIRNIFQNVLYWIEFLRTINEGHQAQQAPKRTHMKMQCLPPHRTPPQAHPRAPPVDCSRRWRPNPPNLTAG
jgi:hypothetical protein